MSLTGARNAHCKYGHSLSGNNLYVTPKGARDCHACRARRAAEYYQKNQERLRLYQVSRLYDLPVDEYNRKLESQRNCCAICNRFMDRPCVDHDHETHQIRDLLCKNCNFALGLLQDDALIAERAAEYLRKWKS